MTDTKLNGITAVLVRLLFHPKVLYAHPEDKKTAMKEPSLLVCNHTSHLDGPFVNTALRPHCIHSLAAKDRFEQRGFGFFLRHTGCIPIDREHPDMSWIKESVSVLTSNREHVSIYPEGRHGKHRQPLPFHSGAALLAAIARVPVVIVYIDGPVRPFRRNRMIVSAPFYLSTPAEGITTSFITDQTHLLENKMQQLIIQMETLYAG